MMSLARRTRARNLAMQLGAANSVDRLGVAPPMEQSGDAVNEYRHLLAVLHNDLREIRDIQSVEARNPVKAERALTYADWVAGAIEAGKSGNAVQDEIVVTQMIWAIDYGDYDYALQIAEHVIAHGLQSPEQYKRSAACMIAEEIANDALTSNDSVALATLIKTDQLTVACDMPDQARSKLMKALGRGYMLAAESFANDPENAVAGGKPALVSAALHHLRRAQSLNSKSGVKKDIEVMARLLESLGGAPDDADDGESNDEQE